MKKTLRSAGIALVLAAGLSAQAAPGFAATQPWGSQSVAGQTAGHDGASTASVGRDHRFCWLLAAC